MDINAKWIWANKSLEPDEYILFYDYFQFRGKRTVIRLCSETNYLLKINGKVAGYGQFAGFPFEKYYDEIDVTDYCMQGENLLEITVWYEGCDTFTHIEDCAGLLFTVVVDGQPILSSGNTTLCALDCNYVQHARRIVTVQVGYTSSMVKDGGMQPLPVKTHARDCMIKPRPVKKLVEAPPVLGKPLRIADKRIYDLGAETAGYAFLVVDCENDCTVTLTYGEQLLTGEVSRIIPGGYKNVGRDFSMDFKCKKGKNTFTNYFLRLAGRYLQIYADAPIKVEKVGLIPVYYPLTEKSIALSGIDKQIYDVAVRTLRLCMHEHYEDCPWREQALYSLDSRNQMLCGYYAFKKVNFSVKI